MLSYTLTRMLTQRAVIQRDSGEVDAYGADGTPDWQDYLTVPCRLAWAKSEGARSASRTFITPARTAPVSEGGVLVPLGTPVTETDRVARILQWDPVMGSWEPYIDGIFMISMVLTNEHHVELSVSRTHLGG